MDRYRVADEQIEPTHDEDRDIGAPTSRRVHYDLTPGDRTQPVVENSFSLHDTQYGETDEERPGFIQSGGMRVQARSGNRHWDDGEGEGYEEAGDGRVLGAEVRGEDPGRPFALAITVISGLALLYYLTRKER